jgi:hypothetical protein
MTDRQAQLAVAGLAGVTAVNAVGGAVYGLSGAPAVPREWLRGSPFADYRVPSVILGTVVGGSAAAAAVGAWRASPWSGRASVLAGAVLSGWIAAQLASIGLRSPLQPAMAAVGVTLIGLGARRS